MAPKAPVSRLLAESSLRVMSVEDLALCLTPAARAQYVLVSPPPTFLFSAFRLRNTLRLQIVYMFVLGAIVGKGEEGRAPTQGQPMLTLKRLLSKQTSPEGPPVE